MSTDFEKSISSFQAKIDAKREALNAKAYEIKNYLNAIVIKEINEKSYFFIRFGDFLSGMYHNAKKYQDKQKENKQDLEILPYMNFHVNNMIDLYDHLENDFICQYFYLVIIFFYFIIIYICMKIG